MEHMIAAKKSQAEQVADLQNKIENIGLNFKQVDEKIENIVLDTELNEKRMEAKINQKIKQNKEEMIKMTRDLEHRLENPEISDLRKEVRFKPERTYHVVISGLLKFLINCFLLMQLSMQIKNNKLLKKIKECVEKLEEFEEGLKF